MRAVRPRWSRASRARRRAGARSPTRTAAHRWRVSSRCSAIRRSRASILATPHSTHADLIELAAEAGKHVFVEKPLALTVADARRAIEAAERAGRRRCRSGHNRRRQPANRRIQVDGRVGRAGHVRADSRDSIRRRARHKPELPRVAQRSRRVSRRRHDGARRAHRRHVQLLGRSRGTRLIAFSKQVAGSRDLDEATAVLIEYAGGPIGTDRDQLLLPGPSSALAVYGTEANVWNEEDGEPAVHAGPCGQGTRRAAGRARSTRSRTRSPSSPDASATGSRPETGGPEGARRWQSVLEAHRAQRRDGLRGRPVDVALTRSDVRRTCSPIPALTNGFYIPIFCALRDRTGDWGEGVM